MAEAPESRPVSHEADHVDGQASESRSTEAPLDKKRRATIKANNDLLISIVPQPSLHIGSTQADHINKAPVSSYS